VHSNFWSENVKRDLCRLEYNIKCVIKELDCDHPDFNHLAVDRDQRLAVVNVVMNLIVS
jgi:hypothetical protein